jgi:DNA-binding CsgD family transcriptional regulator
MVEMPYPDEAAPIPSTIGRPALAPREQEALRHISQGRTYLQTARRMGVTGYTVDTYLRRIRAKYGIVTKAELTRLAVSLGL